MRSFSDAATHYPQPGLFKTVNAEGRLFTTYGRTVVDLLLQSDLGVRRHAQDLLKSSKNGLCDSLVPHLVITWMTECTASIQWDNPEYSLVRETMFSAHHHCSRPSDSFILQTLLRQAFTSNGFFKSLLGDGESKEMVGRLLICVRYTIPPDKPLVIIITLVAIGGSCPQGGIGPSLGRTPFGAQSAGYHPSSGYHCHDVRFPHE